MNFSVADLNISRLETFTSSRQARFLGPLLSFFLASIFPNVAVAKIGHIKIEYDPLPLIPSNPTSIAIYQTPIPTWEHVTKPVEEHHLEPIGEPQQYIEDPGGYSEVVSTNIESPSAYLLPPQSQAKKISVKRAISQRYLAAYRRNRFNTRKRFPDYFEYDNYDYLTTPKLRNRKRNNGRRPIGFDDDYDYDYDYGKPYKRKNQRRRNKNKNRRDPDYYSDEEFNDDVEPVTVVLRPRQQQTTTPPTTMETTTMITMTNITNGTTPSTTTTTTINTTATGYGYGPYTGNENVSITYGPPYGNKPVYGVPGTIAGNPLGEWTPSYVYETPSSYYSQHQTSYSPNSYQLSNSFYNSPSTSYNLPSTSYGTPSISYGLPSATYGAPSSSSSGSYSPSSSYGRPSATYGAPSSSYGVPSSSYGTPSATYGTPSSTYGVPSSIYGAARPPSTTYGHPAQSYGTPFTQGTSYQSYQLPYSSWYGRAASNSDMIKRVQNVIRYN